MQRAIRDALMAAMAQAQTEATKESAVGGRGARAEAALATWGRNGNTRLILWKIRLGPEYLVGVAGFEPATPTSRTWWITGRPLKLRRFS